MSSQGSRMYDDLKQSLLGSAAFALRPAWDNVSGQRCTPWRPSGSASFAMARRMDQCMHCQGMDRDVRPGVPRAIPRLLTWQAWDNVLLGAGRGRMCQRPLCPLGLRVFCVAGMGLRRLIAWQLRKTMCTAKLCQIYALAGVEHVLYWRVTH